MATPEELATLHSASPRRFSCVGTPRRQCGNMLTPNDDPLQRSVVILAQMERLVMLVQTYGKLAAWCLVGSASFLSAGLIAHAELRTELWLGVIGALLGTGLYPLVWRFTGKGMDELHQTLDELKQMRDAKDISEVQYEKLRDAAVAKARKIINR